MNIDDIDESDEEILYYRAIDTYVEKMGFYLPLLELQGTDEEYCIATLKVHKSGFINGQSPVVIGALVLDSVRKYHANRDLAILFLRAIEKNLNEPV